MVDNAQESKEYPGFFVVPPYNGRELNLLINKEGDVRKRDTGEFYKKMIGSNGYFMALWYPVHRLLGLTFISRPHDWEHRTYVINHKDGNKTNIELDNLEWVTYSENSNHAYRTGLRTDVRRLIARSDKGEIREFHSLNECARFFEKNPAYIAKWVAAAGYVKTPKGFYMIINDGEVWPDMAENHFGSYYAGQIKPFIGVNPAGAIFLFERMSDAACMANLNKDALGSYMLRYQECMYHNWFFAKYGTESFDKLKYHAVQIQAPPRSWKPTPRRPIPVKATNVKNGEIADYVSCEVLASVYGVSKSAVQKFVGTGKPWRNMLLEYV